MEIFYENFTGKVEELYLLDKNNDTNHWQQTNFYGKHKIIVAKNIDEIAGFLIYSDNFEVEILRICISIKYRRRGIAKNLLQLLPKNQQILLEVRQNNISAIKLYQQFGFQQIAIRKKYYQNNENAIVMAKQ